MTEEFARKAILKAQDDNFEKLMPEYVSSLKKKARMRYEHYKAHMDAGFTSDQALVMCMKLFEGE